jgi:hypothetical protein
MKRIVIISVGVLVLGVVVVALFAPYVYGELAVWMEPHTIIDPTSAKLAKGRMVDDYFAVEDLGRVFPVNGQMTLATGFPWNNR